MDLKEILKYDCKTDKLNRMTKEELFELEEKLNSITTRWINTQMQGKSHIERDRARDKISRIKKKVRRVLYECNCCADAKFNVMIDGKAGDEREYMVKDCGLDECAYKDFFKKNAVSKVDKELKKMLKEIG